MTYSFPLTVLPVHCYSASQKIHCSSHILIHCLYSPLLHLKQHQPLHNLHLNTRSPYNPVSFKNKVRDSASSLKENVKDLPTQAGYAVHSAKQKAKDNVSDFKRGVVEERENRQEQRTQKRNLHRENISQKKQELQKAQEARQTVHANGSATAGATRSHERPVATPVPKTAQTDTVIKPDMKRPATSPVIKNAEIKAGKETVRTNIRQEQQVKSVAKTNQPNVAETISNHKKSTVQKTQVNGKSARKTVTKHSEKGRKK